MRGWRRVFIRPVLARPGAGAGACVAGLAVDCCGDCARDEMQTIANPARSNIVIEIALSVCLDLGNQA